MNLSIMDAPNLELEAEELLDWLELNALFNEFGIARLDEVVASLRQQEAENEDNIADADAASEDLRNRIENEFNERENNLKSTYPFKLSDSGEELELVDDWKDEIFAFYLVSLVTSHATGSAFLRKAPEGDLLTRLRNRVFQILSTLAIAGLARGGAISIGWPRQTGEAVVDIVSRAARIGAGFNPRVPPGPYTPPQEKDGGVDVLAWTGDRRPPPSAYFFGQAASGRNWRGKPVVSTVFKNSYILDMHDNINHATVIPFRVADENVRRAEILHHRTLIDRLSLPPNAHAGLELARNGMPIDEAENMDTVLQWLEDYRVEVLS